MMKVKVEQTSRYSNISNPYLVSFGYIGKAKKIKKVSKGTWGMPRLSEAKKDVISCEKLRGGANNLRSVDLRMGQPDRRRFYHTVR